MREREREICGTVTRSSNGVLMVKKGSEIEKRDIHNSHPSFGHALSLSQVPQTLRSLACVYRIVVSLLSQQQVSG